MTQINETVIATSGGQVTTYREKMHKNTLYRVTSVYMGKFELGKALEDLTVKKILRDENNAAGALV